jgi:hypothetical protein
MVTVWLHVTALPQQSLTVHVRVTMTGQKLAVLVTVLVTTMVGGFVQQSSIAVGGLKVNGVPQLIVLLLAQVTTGGCVSMMFNISTHGGEVFEQQSLATQVSV